MSNSDLIALGAIAVTLQGGFLGILLPLFYSLYEKLLEVLSASNVDKSSYDFRRVAGYLGTVNTLFNIAVGVWLSCIVLNLALLGARLTTNYDRPIDSAYLYMSISALIALPTSALGAIFAAYYDEGTREQNLFCFPENCNEAPIRYIFSIVLVVLFVGGSYYVAQESILAGTVKNAGLASGNDAAVFAILISVLYSVSLVLIWVLLSIFYRPFEAIANIRTHTASNQHAPG